MFTEYYHRRWIEVPEIRKCLSSSNWNKDLFGPIQEEYLCLKTHLARFPRLQFFNSCLTPCLVFVCERISINYERISINYRY